MKRMFLTCGVVALGCWLQAQAGPLAGCFDVQPPGQWSEFLQGGETNQIGNEFTAWAANYTLSGAKLTFVTNDVSGEWDWLTKYEGATLWLTNVPGAPWFSKCEGEVTFQAALPELWIKTRNDRYAATNAGYTEFLFSATNGSVSIKGTFAGMPTFTPQETPTVTNVVASGPLATATICVGQTLKVDVIPTPFNVKSKGVLPVAIRGTRNFDVKSIDPSTIKLECAPALRWVYAKGQGGKLLLKFDRQAIVSNLPMVENGDMVTLTLTATLKDGTPASGTDKVRIIAPKPKPSKPAKPAKPAKPGKK